ncbi:MAG: FAD-dependent oxidoreductase [Clostridia bacterium]|nr:FAD-dependent oxidoreductase [Clostridia bacterium]
MKKYLIIGNSTAAVGCIEGIRKNDKEGKITVVSKENRHTYCRPLISYYLEGKTDLERIKYRPDSFCEENGVKVLYSRSAEKIDSEKRTVTLDDETVLSYDELCVATGSSPFVPPTEGFESVEKKVCFTTLDDALTLEKITDKESRVLIVGAGLIGLKCAEGLFERVQKITVCDLADRVLSTILDKESSDMVQRKLTSVGIDLLLSDCVEKFEGNKAFMKSGKEVEFDVLVTAVGVRPNTKLLSEIGGKCGRGITVDESMKTSVENIYAAGDCTESTDISDGKTKIMALLPNAYMQGFCAGENMAGKPSVFDNAIPMNSIGFFGIHIMTAGSRPTKEEGGEVFEETTEDTLKKLFVKDNRLVGFILIGRTEAAGIYTDMIRSKTDIRDIDFEYLKKQAALFAFGKEKRKEMLGGVSR